MRGEDGTGCAESSSGEMLVLVEWKSIAQYLGKGVRTVQRWELWRTYLCEEFIRGEQTLGYGGAGRTRRLDEGLPSSRRWVFTHQPGA
jgi:hypothetical protein